MAIKVKLLDIPTVSVELEEFKAIKVGLSDISLRVGSIPPYTGDYTITPSGETQVLQTAGKSTISNIVINPIPSNYGRITWNGYTLTVE